MDNNNVSQNRKRTPLPKLQLFTVMLAQLAEPITCTVIFPFINQSVRETGITRGDESKTGYYAGIIESIFFLTECLTVIHWGRASDRIGRKPVLMLGMVGLAISMVTFGLSKHYWAMIMSRSIEGMSNGNIGVSKSIIVEITDATNIADAFAYIPVVWATGSTLGPILGGVLARPATRWPNLFGRSKFFQEYPYFLPCAVAGSFAIICFLVCAIGLKETLPSLVKKKKQDAKDFDSPRAALMNAENADYGTNTIPETQCIEELGPLQPPPIRSLIIRQVLVPLMNLAFLAFTDMSYQVLQPLMFSTPVHLGGLGFTPYMIGMTMGIWGFLNGIFQVLAFSKVVKRLGTRRTYILAYSSLLVCIGAYPAMSWLVKQTEIVDWRIWAVLVVQLSFASILYMAYGCIFMFIISSAPTQTALATINAMGQMTGTIMRSIAPSVASSLYSVSLQHHLAGGYLVYWMLWTITFCGIYASLHLPERTRADYK